MENPIVVERGKIGDAIDFITKKLDDLRDELDHEENVEHDRARVYFLKDDIEKYKNVLHCLYEL